MTEPGSVESPLIGNHCAGRIRHDLSPPWEWIILVNDQITTVDFDAACIAHVTGNGAAGASRVHHIPIDFRIFNRFPSGSSVEQEGFEFVAIRVHFRKGNLSTKNRFVRDATQAANPIDAAFTALDSCPRTLPVGTQRSDQADSGDDDGFVEFGSIKHGQDRPGHGDDSVEKVNRSMGTEARHRPP